MYTLIANFILTICFFCAVKVDDDLPILNLHTVPLFVLVFSSYDTFELNFLEFVMTMICAKLYDSLIRYLSLGFISLYSRSIEDSKRHQPSFCFRLLQAGQIYSEFFLAKTYFRPL